MTEKDLPHTLETAHAPVLGNASQQSTIAAAKSASAEAMPVLDLRSYQLMDRLGGGGMGDVYRAADPALGRDLAAKVMKADFQGDPSAQSRFLREARITGSLQHPGIVPIYNLGRLADGRLHYTMRLVRGRTLADILREEAGQPERLPDLLTIFEKVCQAVAYAHSKRVIHRDLKPANVMVGRFGEVQVMDWGLAKLLTGEDEPEAAEEAAEQGGTRIHTEAGETPLEQTRMGREMGTPPYMPPEQALGEWDTVDERADVFALGAMLCETLTGKPPYSGSEIKEALRKAKRGDLTEASARLEGCGADAMLIGLCRECLAPAREHRPRDGEQVAQRVAAYQAQVQQRLRRAELERAAAVVKEAEERKRRYWMLVAIIFLLAGAAVSTWQAVRATNAETLAQQNEVQALTAVNAEQQAKNLAENRLEQIERANRVLTAIFHDLDPRAEEKGGPSLRIQLGRHLERAAAQLEEAAVADPVAIARLQAALGESLNYLGRFTLALELLAKADRTLEAQLGADHPDTLACKNNLGEAYRYAGRIDQAIQLFEQNLKQREARLGPDHLETLRSRHSLAKAYLEDQRIIESIRLHEQNLKLREAKLGPEHLDTLSSGHNLANAYREADRTAEAIRMYEQILKQREAKLGPDHRDTQHSRNNLANAYLDAGRTAEAIQIYERTLKESEAKLGPDHRDTFISRSNLGTAYLRVGRFAEAICLLEPTLKQIEDHLGPEHPLALDTRTVLANAYQSVGRSSQAIGLYELILKQREAKLGPDHSQTLLSMANLGVAYRDAGRLKEAVPLLETALERGRQRSGNLPRLLTWLPGALVETYERSRQWAKAEPIYRDVLEQVRRKFGPDDLRTASTLVLLAANLLRQKKFEDAESVLRRSLAIREAKQPDEWTTFNTRSVLGESLLGQKKFTQAEPLLVQGYQGVTQRQDKIPPAYRQLRLSEAMERLVRLYEATNQKEKADPLRKKLEETKAAKK
jgi:serine/threonine protein kinase